jgi:hypothetical protein
MRPKNADPSDFAGGPLCSSWYARKLEAAKKADLS